MCKLLTSRNAKDFQPVSRSIRLSGHSTSLRLEASFWRALDSLAKDEGVSTPKLIETLHAEASELLQSTRTRPRSTSRPSSEPPVFWSRVSGTVPRRLAT